MDRLGRVLLALLVAAILFRLAAALFSAGDIELTVWGDRDLWRALTIRQHWPLFGPESNGGTRPPGGAFYLLLAGILAFQPSVAAAHVGAILLFAAAVLLLGLYFAREVSPLAGALVAAAFAGSGLVSQALTVWNPGFIPFFAAGATLAGYDFLKTGRAVPLALAMAALGFGLQVHLQMLQIGAGLLIAVAVGRPRLGRWHAVAALGGLVLPYLPTLLVAGPGLLAQAGALPGDAVTNYVVSDFDLPAKAGLVYELFGGDEGPGLLVAGVRPGGVASLIIATDVLAVGSGVAFLAWPGSRRGLANRAWGFPIAVAMVSVLVILISAANFRHVVAGLPATSIILGLGAERLIERFIQRPGYRRLGRLVTMLVCTGFAVRAAALGYSLMRSHGFLPQNTAAQEEIAATLKPMFFASHEAFESHAGRFHFQGRRGWKLSEEGVSGQMTFIYATSSAPAASADREACVAILDKAEAKGDVRQQLANSPAFAGLDPRFDEKPLESRHFLYWPYATASGNCLKSFPNAYVPTTAEDRHLDPGTPDGETPTSDGLFLSAREPGRPYPLGIEIRRAAGDYQAILHGRLLRGYTGLPFQTLENPVLCLQAADRLIIVDFGRVSVGSPLYGTMVPWASPSFSPPAGNYRLWLSARDGKRSAVVKLSPGILSFPDLKPMESTRETAIFPKGCPDPSWER